MLAPKDRGFYEHDLAKECAESGTCGHLLACAIAALQPGESAGAFAARHCNARP